MRGEFGTDVNRRGSVAGADDRNRDGIELVETEGEGEQQGDKDAELTRRAEQDDLGVFQQRLKIGHGADAEKNQQGKNFGAHAGIVKKTNKAALGHHFRERDIDQNRAEADGH